MFVIRHHLILAADNTAVSDVSVMNRVPYMHRLGLHVICVQVYFTVSDMSVIVKCIDTGVAVAFVIL